MSPSIQSVSIDATDPARLADFWQAALGWRRTYDSPEEVALEPPEGSPEDGAAPAVLLLRVPEEKVGKNRVHLDVNISGGPDTAIEERKRAIEAVAARLEGEGATRVRPFERRGEFWMVMQDPEGNEFCLQ